MSEFNGGTRTTPPGWYADPEMAQTLRYWDGVMWTEHRSPVVAAPPPMPYAPGPAVKEDSNVAGLGYVMAILMPFVGFIIGITQINKRQGPGIVILSIVAFVFWAAVFGGL